MLLTILVNFFPWYTGIYMYNYGHRTWSWIRYKPYIIIIIDIYICIVEMNHSSPLNGLTASDCGANKTC